MEATKIGIVGCGSISGIYLANARRLEAIETAACADLLVERAEVKAKEFGIPKACGVEELLADEEIRIVVNLTTPDAHASVALSALQAGKCVHNEKPLAVTREDGREILATAEAAGLRVGCAPDTFLGAGLQTCRKLIDDGAIGRPIGASAFFACRGHEGWHPDPQFYYKPGGGPMMDMGPYYLTAMVSLLGPVRRVCGSAQKSFPERTIASEPKRGQKIRVEVPTHVAGVLDFASGVVGTILTSFDVHAANLPRIEVYGSEGTLSAPDPNCFAGPVLLYVPAGRNWREVPLTHGKAENSRGLGVADMAMAMRSGRPHRCSGELAYHVLDIMHAVHEASTAGTFVELASTCERPAPLPAGMEDGRLDE